MKKLNIKCGKVKGLVAFIVCLLFVLPAYAQTTSDKIKNLQDEKEKIESDLKDQEKEIDSIKDQKSDLEGYLGDLNSKLSSIVNKLHEIEGKLTDKEKEIEDTEAALVVAKENEEKQYAAMKKRIQFMYEKSDATYVELLFTANSFADFLNRTNYINQLEKYDRNMLEEFRSTRALIKEKEELLVQEKEDLNSLKEEAKANQNKVTGLIGSTSNQISAYSDDIEEAEQQAKAYENSLKANQSSMEELKKQLAAEKAAEEEAARTQKFAQIAITSDAASAGDLALMAAIIECEAGGEPYEGKVAVANVVLNRVNSNRFPNTILEVLYQKNQFTPVMSGRFAIVLARGANNACIQAAQDAFNGASYVGDVLHFRTVTPYIDGIVIGGHVFY